MRYQQTVPNGATMFCEYYGLPTGRSYRSYDVFVEFAGIPTGCYSGANDNMNDFKCKIPQ